MELFTHYCVLWVKVRASNWNATQIMTVMIIIFMSFLVMHRSMLDLHRHVLLFSVCLSFMVDGYVPWC